MRVTFIALAVILAALCGGVRTAAAQTCNERCAQQYDAQNNPIGWACLTTGSNKNCSATTTQCSVTLCGGTGGTKYYTSFSTPDGRLLAVQAQCDVSATGAQSLDVLMVALSHTREGEQLARGVRFARLLENDLTLDLDASSP
jgi:hypothetical protein